MTAKNPELEVFNPFDGSQVGSVKINSANEIEEMLALGFRLHKENLCTLSSVIGMVAVFDLMRPTA